MKFTAGQIAQIIQAKIIGDPEAAVSSFAKIEEAQNGNISFLANPKYQKYALESKASILIINEDFVKDNVEYSATLLLVPDAYAAFTQLLKVYEQTLKQTQQRSGIHASACVETQNPIPSSSYIGAMTVVEEGVSIGAETIIDAQCYIGKHVQIGHHCHIYPGVKILDHCIVEDHVIIHSGAVIGADGFGFAPDAQGVYSKVPQLGNVHIHSNVEIGANTTIDRATMGSTVIGEGVKIDNLVQIAHNVVIEQHTAIAAQAGISGSTKIGKHCIIGGQAGIVGHISLAEGTKINAQSGVAKTVKVPNQSLTGSPAFDYYASLKSQLLNRKLPELFERIKKLEQE